MTLILFWSTVGKHATSKYYMIAKNVFYIR